MYEKPEIKIIEFAIEDIVTASGGNDIVLPEDEWD